MLLVPSTLPVLWLMGLFSALLLGGGAWLVWKWYDNWAAHLPANPRYLIWGALLLALSLLGGPLVTLLLGRRPRPGEAPMKALTGGTVRRVERHQVERPDGTRLHVESFGPEHAPVLLLTHGWGLSSAEWFYARQHLGERYRLLVWDLRGLGQSRGPDDHRYDLDRMAGDLNAVLALAGEQRVVRDSIGVRIILCGHSVAAQCFGTVRPGVNPSWPSVENT